MSDFPIQTTALDELAGGQRSLTPPPERRGNEFPQNFPLSGRPGAQIDNDVQAVTVSPNNANGAASRPSESVSGLNAGSGRGITVKPVDCRTITGSTPGDHRTPSPDTAKSSLTQAAVGAGGPRARVGQFPNGRNDAVNGSFGKDYGTKSFPGDTADSDAGN
jgi:hypothetical protein